MGEGQRLLWVLGAGTGREIRTRKNIRNKAKRGRIRQGIGENPLK